MSYIITSASVLFFSPLCHLPVFLLPENQKIENLQEQLRDKDKQLGNLKDRVKSLQTDSSNTDTALATLEEALSEKVQQTHLCCSSVMVGTQSTIMQDLTIFFFEGHFITCLCPSDMNKV